MADPPFSVDEAITIVHRKGWTGNEFEVGAAAHTLMENCEDGSAVTVREGLACLDVPGTVAACGARILCVLTGRDGLVWNCSEHFSTCKSDWLAYLQDAGIDCDDPSQTAKS